MTYSYSEYNKTFTLENGTIFKSIDDFQNYIRGNKMAVSPIPIDFVIQYLNNYEFLINNGNYYKILKSDSYKVENNLLYIKCKCDNYELVNLLDDNIFSNEKCKCCNSKIIGIINRVRRSEEIVTIDYIII